MEESFDSINRQEIAKSYFVPGLDYLHVWTKASKLMCFENRANQDWDLEFSAIPDPAPSLGEKKQFRPVGKSQIQISENNEFFGFY